MMIVAAVVVPSKGEFALGGTALGTDRSGVRGANSDTARGGILVTVVFDRNNARLFAAAAVEIICLCFCPSVFPFSLTPVPR
jgi:hypothetical protein